jgi:hypothetical protein
VERARELMRELLVAGDERARDLDLLLFDPDELPSHPRDLRSDNTDALATALATEILVQQGKVEAARRVLSDLVPLVRTMNGTQSRPRLYQRDLDVAVALGLAALRADVPQAAVEALTGAEDDTRACARRPVVRLILGRAYYQTGRRSDGIRLLESVLAARARNQSG